MQGTKTVRQGEAQPLVTPLTLPQVISAMQAWKEESLFTEYLTQQATLSLAPVSTDSNVQITPEARRDHITTLQYVQGALQKLQPYLPASDQEFKWVEQLNGYVQRLSASSAPQTPEEQFSQLYALRKWLFWVPVTLLSARKGDVWTLLVLAHFYATALSLDTVFPSIGAAFLSNLAVQPLEEIVRIINTVSTTPSYHYQTASMMMEFPREALTNYRARREWNQHQGAQSPDGVQSVQQQSPYGLDTLNVELGNHFAEYGYSQSLSPAFAPSPLAPSPMHASPPSMLPAGPQSPYLEVPRTSIDGYSYRSVGSSYSTPLSSPAAPPPTTSYSTSGTKAEEGIVSTSAQTTPTVYNFALPPYTSAPYSSAYSSAYSIGGLVAPPPPATVWT
jgi:hypothetical protein